MTPRYRSLSNDHLKERAESLLRTARRPQHADTRWSWSEIGNELGLTEHQARQVVGYIRHEHPDAYWTIGVYRDRFRTALAKEVLETIDGELNQLQHSITRHENGSIRCCKAAALPGNPELAAQLSDMAADHKYAADRGRSQRRVIISILERIAV